ncbi:MAG: glycosyltransferase, partial [Bacteroidetes bacterium]|nr:glycosyltransferase [Bacteroidota bacterium]
LFTPSKDKPPEGEICMGIVKALEDSYGIEYLIRAFKIVVDKGYDSNLLIVGDGSLRKNLEKLTKTLNLSNAVKFIGRVDNYTVVEYLQKMDIFVIPSIRESFGVAAVEASSCAIPVIASKIGGLSEVVIDEKTGFLVAPGDTESIAAKIIKLIEEPLLRQQFGKEGRKFVISNFEWELCASKMEGIYNDIFM